ncbi:MAG TPA: hypothetical protein DCS43_14755 [Verrucomicrobia bacterium]|nr:hypothetical protein [Verrucomicrobiota bacterium]
MSQMTIYLDEASMTAIKRSAKRERVSVSNWARRRLSEAVRHAWPEEYFSLFGALRNADLVRPSQADLAADLPRQEL